MKDDIRMCTHSALIYTDTTSKQNLFASVFTKTKTWPVFWRTTTRPRYFYLFFILNISFLEPIVGWSWWSDTTVIKKKETICRIYTIGCIIREVYKIWLKCILLWYLCHDFPILPFICYQVRKSESKWILKAFLGFHSFVYDYYMCYDLKIEDGYRFF